MTIDYNYCARVINIIKNANKHLIVQSRQSKYINYINSRETFNLQL